MSWYLSNALSSAWHIMKKLRMHFLDKIKFSLWAKFPSSPPKLITDNFLFDTFFLEIIKKK